MSAVGRVVQSARSAIGDPIARRGYVARLKWLVGGATLQAWSLEYRRGLTGCLDLQVERSAEENERIYHCPPNCGAHAPLSHLYKTRYVYRLANSIVNTVSGATLLCGEDEPPFFVRESISWIFDNILSHGLDTPEPGRATQRIPDAATVFTSTPNYYHWLIEELPLVLRAHEEFPETTLIVNETGRTHKHDQVAQHLGMTLRNAPLTVTICDHIMPGRANDSWFIHPQDHERLAKFGRSITKSHSGSNHERIYVSRRKVSRSIPEEDALEDLLSAKEFFIAHLESMPWSDQISLFQTARVVVGPHGAGLSNLVFTPPGAILVELTNGFHYNRCFEWITHVAGHTYIKIEANAQIPPTPASELAQGILSRI